MKILKVNRYCLVLNVLHNMLLCNLLPHYWCYKKLYIQKNFLKHLNL